MGSNPTHPEGNDPPPLRDHGEVSGTGWSNEDYSHDQGLQGGNIKSIQEQHFLTLATELMHFTHLSPLLFQVRGQELLAEISSCGSKPCLLASFFLNEKVHPCKTSYCACNRLYRTPSDKSSCILCQARVCSTVVTEERYRK